jgi:hypothetical protein
MNLVRAFIIDRLYFIAIFYGTYIPITGLNKIGLVAYYLGNNKFVLTHELSTTVKYQTQLLVRETSVQFELL